jgi:dipeptidyl aminopeptidase/acylaminoacyl peptidase
MRYLPLIVLTIFFFSACTSKKSTPGKSYSIAQLYENKAIWGAGFNADEQKVLVHSNATGIYNIFSINIADTASTQLTHSTKDSYFAGGYVPATNDYLYVADQGGNENNHVYLQKADGSPVEDLTPWPNSTNGIAGWSKDKQSLYISSNKRDQKFFDVYKFDKNTWKAEMLFQNDLGYSPGSVSASERYISLTKDITTDKNELYVYDRQTKTLKKLSNDHEAVWYPQAFAKDDSALYYLTNDNNEFTYLVKYDIKTGQVKKLYGTNWDVIGMELSDQGKYYSVYINEDGKYRVLLFDNASGQQMAFPEVEDGDVRSITFAPSEKNLLLTVSSSRSPDNLYVYNLENNS